MLSSLSFIQHLWSSLWWLPRKHPTINGIVCWVIWVVFFFTYVLFFRFSRMSIFNFYNPKKRFKKPHIIPVSQETFRGFKGVRTLVVLWAYGSPRIYLLFSFAPFTFLFFFLSERLCIFSDFRMDCLHFSENLKESERKSLPPHSQTAGFGSVFLCFVHIALHSVSVNLCGCLCGCLSSGVVCLWFMLSGALCGQFGLVHLKARGQEQALRVEILVQYVKIPDANFCTWFRFLAASRAPTWTPRGPREIRCRGDFF